VRFRSIRPSAAAMVALVTGLLTFIALDTTTHQPQPAAEPRAAAGRHARHGGLEAVAPATAALATPEPGENDPPAPWRHVKLIDDRVLVLDGRTHDGDATVLWDTGLRGADLPPVDRARFAQGIDLRGDSEVARYLQRD
jgi:hypothetical protein